MLRRDYIENFLRLNGLSSSHHDDDIRTVLLDARWNSEDVEDAILILRGKKNDPELTITSVHELLNTDRKVAPETLSALLGVSHTIKQSDMRRREPLERLYEEYRVPQWFLVALLSSIIAVIATICTMYAMTTGVFYSPVEQFLF